MKNPHTHTRESWLLAAVAMLRRDFPEVGIPEVNVSCSWPGGGSPQKRLGECWPRAASKAGVNEVFISPKIEDAQKVLGILAHECAHAVDDCKSGHRKGFTKIARELRCEGKATSMVPPDEVTHAWKVRMEGAHGPYPHRMLDKAKNGQKKQTTRMIKCECPECSALWRMTAKVVAMCEHGMFCPACGGTDAQAEITE